ncbi:MAG: hypothetical protein XD70_0963 [Thermovirga lienii]|nr:MAG: hypothetical protein XD70_0963 [Thermovirga lienii]
MEFMNRPIMDARAEAPSPAKRGFSGSPVNGQKRVVDSPRELDQKAHLGGKRPGLSIPMTRGKNVPAPLSPMLR